MTVSSTRARAVELPSVFGRYLLLRRLSRGGMGEIFVARHGMSGFEKLVVIKKVLPHLAEDEQFIGRFIDEAQVAIKLQHATIAQVFEVGRVDSEYFLALEYVEGRDIRRTLSLLDDRDERLPVEMALYVAREVAAGLSYAHRRTDDEGRSLELVHCDISPPNIMVSFEGEVKIIDFGIAKSAMRATATDPKMGFGKFGYMAPEQLIRGGEVDFRTDIYACGVVLYELLTGDRLYAMGETPDYRALARMVARGEHPLPSHIEPELAPYDELVARALMPKPEDRYQTAAEFRDAIQHALVAISPTMNAEHAGAFMRQLFTEEVYEQRQMIAEMESTDLRAWEEMMTTQSATTVSYALAHMPLVAPPPESATELVVRSRGPASQVVVPSRKKSRRGIALALVVIALLTGGSVLAWVLGSGKKEEAARSATKSPGAGEPDPGGVRAGIEPSVTSIAIDAGPSERAVPATARMARERRRAQPKPKGDAAEGESRRRPAAKPRIKARPPGPRARPKARQKSDPEEQPIDAAAVRKRFQAVYREYRGFKKLYGARLEKQWGDLATYAQFASSPDKLRVLDRKISRFRAQMRAQRN